MARVVVPFLGGRVVAGAVDGYGRSGNRRSRAVGLVVQVAGTVNKVVGSVRVVGWGRRGGRVCCLLGGYFLER